MTSPKHRILFKGYYNVHNFGDDLLFIALLDFFKNQMGWEQDDLRVFVEPEEKSLKKLGYKHPYKLRPYLDPLKKKHLQLKQSIRQGAISKALMVFYMFGCLLSALIYRLTKFRLGNHKNIRFFRNLDIIHYIGGGYFNTRLTWGFQLLVYEFFLVTMAKLINPKLQVIGTGLGIGPINNGFYKKLFKYFVKNFDYIFVREKESEAFIKSLSTARHVQCIGDDVVLLLPYFKQIAENTKPKAQLSLNIKFDNVHDYRDTKSFFYQLLQGRKQLGEDIVFFNFGRDHLALNQLPSELVQQLTIHSCYETGLQHFAQCMAESQKGIGFAYHFAILCALLNIPSANVYFDEYYRQKTGGVIQLLCNQHLTLPYQALKSATPEQLLKELDTVDQQKVPLVFNQLVTYYKNAYLELEKSRHR